MIGVSLGLSVNIEMTVCCRAAMARC